MSRGRRQLSRHLPRRADRLGRCPVKLIRISTCPTLFGQFLLTKLVVKLAVCWADRTPSEEEVDGPHRTQTHPPLSNRPEGTITRCHNWPLLVVSARSYGDKYHASHTNDPPRWCK